MTGIAPRGSELSGHDGNMTVPVTFFKRCQMAGFGNVTDLPLVHQRRAAGCCFAFPNRFGSQSGARIALLGSVEQLLLECQKIRSMYQDGFLGDAAAMALK